MLSQPISDSLNNSQNQNEVNYSPNKNKIYQSPIQQLFDDDPNIEFNPHQYLLAELMKTQKSNQESQKIIEDDKILIESLVQKNKELIMVCEILQKDCYHFQEVIQEQNAKYEEQASTVFNQLDVVKKTDDDGVAQENSSLTQENVSLKQQIQELIKKYGECQKLLQQKNKEFQIIVKEVEQLRDDLLELQKQKCNSMQSSATFMQKSQLQDRNIIINNMQNQIQSYKEVYQNSLNEISKLKQQLDFNNKTQKLLFEKELLCQKFQEQNNSIVKNFQLLQNDYNKQKQENEQLKNKYKDLEQNQILYEQYKKIQQQLDEEKQKNQAQFKIITNLENDLKSEKDEIKQKDQKIEENSLNLEDKNYCILLIKLENERIHQVLKQQIDDNKYYKQQLIILEKKKQENKQIDLSQGQDINDQQIRQMKSYIYKLECKINTYQNTHNKSILSNLDLYSNKSSSNLGSHLGLYQSITHRGSIQY